MAQHGKNFNASKMSREGREEKRRLKKLFPSQPSRPSRANFPALKNFSLRRNFFRKIFFARA
jgi:hypothetical protein